MKECAAAFEHDMPLAEVRTAWITRGSSSYTDKVRNPFNVGHVRPAKVFHTKYVRFDAFTRKG